MKTIEVIGQVDSQHRLSAKVPAEIPPGPVKLLVQAGSSGEDEMGNQWQAAIAREWHDELSDPREDIYTLDDGEPVDEAR